jgi:NADH-quinone oxidoreductase subunit A
MEAYWPILIFLVISVGFAVSAIVLSHLLGPKRKIKNLEPYECGIIPKGDSKIRYSVRFYLVALLFLIFDVEIALLFPYAIQVEELKISGFIEIAIFVFILFTGLLYVWRKGGLEWE